MAVPARRVEMEIEMSESAVLQEKFESIERTVAETKADVKSPAPWPATALILKKNSASFTRR